MDFSRYTDITINNYGCGFPAMSPMMSPMMFPMMGGFYSGCEIGGGMYRHHRPFMGGAHMGMYGMCGPSLFMCNSPFMPMFAGYMAAKTFTTLFDRLT